MEVLENEKILVIQTAFIGDAVLTLPMIQKLKERYPSIKLDVICIPATAEIFQSSPAVDEVIINDKHGKQKSFFQMWTFAKEIKNKKYNRIYSPHRSFRTALIVMLSGVKETYGFSNSSFKYVYKYLIEYYLDRHEVQRNLDLIGFKYSGMDWKILPELKVDDSIIQKVGSFLTLSNKKTFIAVAPGAVWNTKIFPADYYCELITFLTEKNNNVILIGGKSDVKLCSEIESRFENAVISSAGKFSVPGTIELLKKCRLLITNDSAPTHFAMAANIPTITIYCSTVPDFGFYPFNEKSFSISYNDLSCKPCGIHGHKTCPIKTFECAHNLDINQIKKKIIEILND
jgi:heptosyltransferase-2